MIDEDPRTDPKNEDLLQGLLSDICWCKEKKTSCVTFCRECYLAIPFELRIDLWKPWRNGFAEIYASCIDYLDTETVRLKCPTIIASSPTSTSSSGKAKRKSSGKLSKEWKKRMSVFAPETSPD